MIVMKLRINLKISIKIYCDMVDVGAYPHG